MPGYIIHLTEAERVLNRMPQGLKQDIIDRKAWHDAFICGVLLPDAAGKRIKKQTHYWNERDMEDAIVVPDLELFLQRYCDSLRQPMVLGYLTHLHLDKVFFTEYFRRKVRFLDENGQETFERQKVHSAWHVEEQRRLSAAELFSQEWLYGDYTKLNTLLIGRHGLLLPEKPLHLDNPFGMDTAKLMEQAFTEIVGYLEESKTTVDEPRLLSVDSLERFMDEAAEELWTLVGKNLEKKGER